MEPRNLRSGASDTPPVKLVSPSVGYPSPGNPATGTPAAVGGAFWNYALSEEMRNVIVGAGLTPNDDELDQFWQAIQALLVPGPVGSLLIMDGDVMPNGYLERDGAALSREDYADLWAYAQTVSNFTIQSNKTASYNTYAGYYGDGDGSTTFTIPDMRGEFIRGFDSGRGIDVGRAIASLQLDEFKNHIHPYQRATIQGNTGASGIVADNGNYTGQTANFTSYINSAGGIETRPRNIAMMFCVKY